MSFNAQAHNSEFQMPLGFATEAFDRIWANVRDRLQPPYIDHIAGGHNAVRFRLRAAADYSRDFTDSVRSWGATPALERRYQQERQLFGFFVSGLSAIDSFCYLVYFIAASIRASEFPISRPRRITARNTVTVFQASFPAERLTQLLTAVINHPNFEQWTDVRNILTHRTAPGRRVFASVGSTHADPAPLWRVDLNATIQIDENLTIGRLNWLVSTLSDLLRAADAFVQQHF